MESNTQFLMKTVFVVNGWVNRGICTQHPQIVLFTCPFVLDFHALNSGGHLNFSLIRSTKSSCLVLFCNVEEQEGLTDRLRQEIQIKGLTAGRTCDECMSCQTSARKEVCTFTEHDISAGQMERNMESH